MVSGREARAHSLPTEVTENKKPALLWKAAIPNNKYYASPVCHDGILYILAHQGMLTALDANSGEKIYSKQLDVKKGICYSSLGAAGGHLFASSEAGSTVVLKLGKEAEQVGQNSFEKLRSCLVFDGNRIYARTLNWILCIGKLP